MGRRALACIVEEQDSGGIHIMLKEDRGDRRRP
jgi:hypothetical protein